MRVLHVVTNFEKLAGAEQALINLVGSGFGRENLIVSLRSDALARQTPLPDTCRTKALGLPRASLNQVRRELSETARDYKPDVVIGWMYHGNVAASLLCLTTLRSCPVVWTVHHALDDWGSESRSTKLAIAGSALVSRMASAIVYASSRSMNQHRLWFGNAKRSVVIPNVVQVDRPQTGAVRTSGKTVGFAARYHPTKDFQTFMRTVRAAHASDPSVRFIACGEGATSDNPALAEMARNEGLGPEEIEWLGPIRDMGSFYDSLDVFLLTSRAEGFGMVLAEATGRGIPCVTTDVGAAREIVGHNGQITQVGDVAALASGILAELGRAESEKHARSERAMANFEENFHPSAIRRKYDDLLFRLVVHP